MILETAPRELLTTAQMRQADRYAVQNGALGRDLMECAGAAVADAALTLLGGRGRVAVFCGPGANGGDGFVAARKLEEAGCKIDLALLGYPRELRGDAAAAAARWGGAVLAADDVALDPCDLAVDALFGAGLSRPLDGAALALVSRIAQWTRVTGRPVVAVDVPSGVDGDTGLARGQELQATTTVTFFRLKPGHLLLPGRTLCGRIILVDIGVPDAALASIAPQASANGVALWRGAFPQPKTAGHKYDRGHALVVSGPAFQTGAARLAARAALRIGAGLVTLAAPSDALPAIAGSLTAVMLARADGGDSLEELLQDPRTNAVVLGPGLGVGTRARELVQAALRRRGVERRGVVLDADALTSFAGQSGRLTELTRDASSPAVLTPHEGEFQRVFGEEFGALSKLERARSAAKRTGAIVVLKGADTVIADSDGRAAIGSVDAPWLATAGSGDVLAGFIGGLLAQGMPSFEAACAAVHLHALTARNFGLGLISEDLPERLPSVLASALLAKASGR